MDVYANLKQGERGVWISIIAYIFCSIVKVAIAWYAGSEALLADGLNNTTDVVASIAVLIGLRIARKPPDKDHPYGHFRAETISALVASFIMFAVGVEVLLRAVPSLFSPESTAPDIVAGWVALGSAALMLLVYRYNIRLAKSVNSQALEAAAMDNRSDAWVSIGTFAGIAGAQFQLHWLDPLAALVVGLIIVKTAWDIFREATHRLTDGFDFDELENLKGTISKIPGVSEIKDIKARYLGSSIIVDATIHVDPELNVLESHVITEQIEQRMSEEHRIKTVHIHIEPDERLAR
ncbi:cation diffusion facilitator family transporter [Brevibacillus ruminantium]|uniref:Cation diffusion facilitator family transporter n=1 Tax=Brevibacillus ruminantium TaxID=2950604 RepID=A0ABY4WM25_9BACL|nr:cation diffusion facilitator family transporter [Brevibacillus ruminantium]USG67724.1 cation diffusion facilitator family transporter [Brevibacillus ruminantium]